MSQENKKLDEKVAEFKLIARESLRMELISARLSKVATYEEEVKSLNESKNRVEHDVKVENYEISKLDQEHPNYEKTKTHKEETVKMLEDEVKNIDKEVEEVNKLITEQKEAIEKIQTGETKVSLEKLNALVNKMIEEDALKKVS